MNIKAFMIGLMMGGIPWGSIAEPYGETAQIIGIIIQFAGLGILIINLIRLIKENS